MASDFRWCLHLGNSQIIFRLIQDRKRVAILSRRILTDGQCAIIAPLVPGKQGDRGRTGTDNRLFLDAILWLARGASPRRNLPPEPGNWRTGHSQFRHWTIAGVWARFFSERSARTRASDTCLSTPQFARPTRMRPRKKGGLTLPVLAAPKAV